MPDDEITVERQTGDMSTEYQPLPILDVQLEGRQVGPMLFVRLLYKDIGGEKVLWVPPPMAVELGNDLVKIGNAMQGMSPGGLMIARTDVKDLMAQLGGPNGPPHKR